MKADKKLYRCECGYVTHFEKALEAHCRFRHHKPLEEKAVEVPQIKEIEPAEPIPAEEPKQEVEPAAVVRKTSRRRGKRGNNEQSSI